ncbi:MAG: tetratricopeptide repeat protein [Fimbriimonadaceae bacterium]|nr:MAG: tetratricopeptide repeat protein [Fimbriimonadaceae bacterium]
MSSLRRRLAHQRSHGQTDHRALFQIATAAHLEGRLAEAEAGYLRILSAEPNHAKASQYLGALLFQTGRETDGTNLLEAAVESHPDDAEALTNLANVYRMQARYAEAVALLERAVRIEPGLPAVHINLAPCLRSLGRLDEALAAGHEAVRLQPDSPSAHNALASCLLWAGFVEEAVAHLDETLRLAPDFAEASQVRLFALLNSGEWTAERIAEEARTYGARFRPVPASVPDRPLKSVAFLSGDFRRHPVGLFLAPMLEQMGMGLRIVALSTGQVQDEVTERIAAACDAWHDVRSLRTADLVALARSEGVDVLVDLAGYTGDNRADAVAARMAPVQVSWLGYSGSTGLPTMDWVFADDTVVPPGHEGQYTERVFRLPSFLSFDPASVPGEATEPPMVREGCVTFGSFNSCTKIGPAAIHLWAETLRAVPGSRILLKDQRFSSGIAMERVLGEFQSAGIGRERVDFLPGLSFEKHLEAFSKIDVALDTTPYGGATTTLEALAMGVPVVSLTGDRYVSLMSASILERAGCGEWVSDSPAGYVETAKGLVADAARLSEVRCGLRRRLCACPLTDIASYAASFEAALKTVWTESRTQETHG